MPACLPARSACLPVSPCLQVSLLAAAGAAPAAAPAGTAVPQTRSSNTPTTAPSRSEGVDLVPNNDNSGQVTQVRACPCYHILTGGLLGA
jgi:hypothetical protein